MMRRSVVGSIVTFLGSLLVFTAPANATGPLLLDRVGDARPATYFDLGSGFDAPLPLSDPGLDLTALRLAVADGTLTASISVVDAMTAPTAPFNGRAFDVTLGHDEGLLILNALISVEGQRFWGTYIEGHGPNGFDRAVDLVGVSGAVDPVGNAVTISVSLADLNGAIAAASDGRDAAVGSGSSVEARNMRSAAYLGAAVRPLAGVEYALGYDTAVAPTDGSNVYVVP